jgi:hypothetical protein
MHIYGLLEMHKNSRCVFCRIYLLNFCETCHIIQIQRVAWMRKSGCHTLYLILGGKDG